MMKDIRKVLLVGAGAIGGAVAKRLYDWDPACLKVLAGGERARRYRENGLVINGRRYDFQVADPDSPDGPADLILVAVKFYDLDEAIRNMRLHVGSETIILSLMNGISSEEMLGKALGMEKILYGLVISIDGNRDQNEIRFTSYGTIVFGEAANTIWSDKVQAVARLFDKAGIVYRVPEDMMHALWYKYMINIGINQGSVALMAPYGVFQDVPDAEAVVESAMLEVIRIANHRGIGLGVSDLVAWRSVLAGMNPGSRTSMLDDLLCGRRTEVEMLSGTLVRLGRDYGIETPVNELLYHLIRAREQMSRQPN